MSDFHGHMRAYDQSPPSQDMFQPSDLNDAYSVCTYYKDEPDYKVFLVEDEAGAVFLMKVASGFRAQALQREHGLLTQLHHPCFPSAIRCVQKHGQTFLFRQYVPGRTLAEVAEDHLMPPDEVVRWTLAVCDIVSLLHHQAPPIIHRDIKPQNFIVGQDGQLVLIDLDSAQAHDPEKTMDTVLMGTLSTAAPEQFGARRSDVRADIYGIGMLMLYLLTNDFLPARLAAHPAPPWLKHVIRRCTSFDPSRRYAGIEQLKAALGHGMGRKRRRMALCCALVLLCVAIAAALPVVDNIDAAISPGNGAQSVAFAEPLIERAAAYQLGKSPGTLTRADLNSIHTLLLCGDTPYDYWGEAENAGRGNTFINIPRGSWKPKGGDIRSLEDLRHMPNLRRLGLYHQAISDISALAKLPLTHLALGENPIRDFSVLTSLTQLEYLDVGATSFGDVVPLSACKSLKTLRIFDTLVWDLSPIAGLPIVQLALKYENVKKDMAVLESFANLACLKINVVPADKLEMIGGLTTLEILDLVNYQGESLAPLEGLQGLRQLFVASGRLRSLEGAQALASLETLVVDHNRVGDLSPLFGLSGLKELSIGDTDITDYQQVFQLPGLRRLSVPQNQLALFLATECPFEVGVEAW